MPFIPVGDVTKHAPGQKKLLLVSGVIGDTELYSLGHELSAEWPVYIYQHPKHHGQNKLFANFDAYLKHIAEEIAGIPNINSGFIPLGYSLGGVIAEVLAHTLKQEQPSHKVFAGLIDTAAISLLKNRFKTKSAELTEKLIEILNTAAMSAGMPTREFSPDEIHQIQQLDPTMDLSGESKSLKSDQITVISGKIVETALRSPNLPTNALSAFGTKVQVINQHLALLATCDFRPNKNHKPDSICSWTTDETEKEYGESKNEGRKKQSIRFSVKKMEGTHLSCIDKDHAADLASSISRHLMRRLGINKKVREQRMASDDLSTVFHRPSAFTFSDSSPETHDSSPDTSPTSRNRKLHNESPSSSDNEDDRSSQDSLELKMDSQGSFAGTPYVGKPNAKHQHRLFDPNRPAAVSQRAQKLQQLRANMGNPLTVDTASNNSSPSQNHMRAPKPWYSGS